MRTTKTSRIPDESPAGDQTKWSHAKAELNARHYVAMQVAYYGTMSNYPKTDALIFEHVNLEKERLYNATEIEKSNLYTRAEVQTMITLARISQSYAVREGLHSFESVLRFVLKDLHEKIVEAEEYLEKNAIRMKLSGSDGAHEVLIKQRLDYACKYIQKFADMLFEFESAWKAIDHQTKRLQQSITPDTPC